MYFIARVEAVQHFLFGIAIDEGCRGSQAMQIPLLGMSFTVRYMYVYM